MRSHGGLHNCQKIFCSVINLATEKGNKPFLSLTIRNIACNFRRPNHSALFILDRGHGERNINQTSVFSHSNRVIVVNMLAAPNSFKNESLFVFTVCRNKDCNRFPNNFFCRIAKNSLSAFVPRSDNSF